MAKSIKILFITYIECLLSFNPSMTEHGRIPTAVITLRCACAKMFLGGFDCIVRCVSSSR